MCEYSYQRSHGHIFPVSSNWNFFRSFQNMSPQKNIWAKFQKRQFWWVNEINIAMNCNSWFRNYIPISFFNPSLVLCASLPSLYFWFWNLPTTGFNIQKEQLTIYPAFTARTPSWFNPSITLTNYKGYRKLRNLLV